MTPRDVDARRVRAIGFQSRGQDFVWKSVDEWLKNEITWLEPHVKIFRIFVKNLDDFDFYCLGEFII